MSYLRPTQSSIKKTARSGRGSVILQDSTVPIVLKGKSKITSAAKPMGLLNESQVKREPSFESIGSPSLRRKLLSSRKRAESSSSQGSSQSFIAATRKKINSHRGSLKKEGMVNSLSHELANKPSYQNVISIQLTTAEDQQERESIQCMSNPRSSEPSSEFKALRKKKKSVAPEASRPPTNQSTTQSNYLDRFKSQRQAAKTFRPGSSGLVAPKKKPLSTIQKSIKAPVNSNPITLRPSMGSRTRNLLAAKNPNETHDGQEMASTFTESLNLKIGPGLTANLSCAQINPHFENSILSTTERYTQSIVQPAPTTSVPTSPRAEVVQSSATRRTRKNRKASQVAGLQSSGKEESKNRSEFSGHIFANPDDELPPVKVQEVEEAIEDFEPLPRSGPGFESPETPEDEQGKTGYQPPSEGEVPQALGNSDELFKVQAPSFAGEDSSSVQKPDQESLWRQSAISFAGHNAKFGEALKQSRIDQQNLGGSFVSFSPAGEATSLKKMKTQTKDDLESEESDHFSLNLFPASAPYVDPDSPLRRVKKVSPPTQSSHESKAEEEKEHNRRSRMAPPSTRQNRPALRQRLPLPLPTKSPVTPKFFNGLEESNRHQETLIAHEQTEVRPFLATAPSPTKSESFNETCQARQPCQMTEDSFMVESDASPLKHRPILETPMESLPEEQKDTLVFGDNQSINFSVSDQHQHQELPQPAVENTMILTKKDEQFENESGHDDYRFFLQNSLSQIDDRFESEGEDQQAALLPSQVRISSVIKQQVDEQSTILNEAPAGLKSPKSGLSGQEKLAKSDDGDDSIFQYINKQYGEIQLEEPPLQEETKIAISQEEAKPAAPMSLNERILLRKKNLKEAAAPMEEPSVTQIVEEDYQIPDVLLAASETTSLLSSRIDQVDRDSMLDKKMMSMINFEEEEDEIDRELREYGHHELLFEEEDFLFYEEAQLEAMSLNLNFDEKSAHYFSDLFRLKSKQLKEKRFNKFTAFKDQKEVLSHRIQLEMFLKPGLQAAYYEALGMGPVKKKHMKRDSPIKPITRGARAGLEENQIKVKASKQQRKKMSQALMFAMLTNLKKTEPCKRRAVSVRRDNSQQLPSDPDPLNLRPIESFPVVEKQLNFFVQKFISSLAGMTYEQHEKKVAEAKPENIELEIKVEALKKQAARKKNPRAAEIKDRQIGANRAQSYVSDISYIQKGDLNDQWYKYIFDTSQTTTMMMEPSQLNISVTPTEVNPNDISRISATSCNVSRFTLYSNLSKFQNVNAYLPEEEQPEEEEMRLINDVELLKQTTSSQPLDQKVWIDDGDPAGLLRVLSKFDTFRLIRFFWLLSPIIKSRILKQRLFFISHKRIQQLKALGFPLEHRIEFGTVLYLMDRLHECVAFCRSQRELYLKERDRGLKKNQMTLTSHDVAKLAILELSAIFEIVSLEEEKPKLNLKKSLNQSVSVDFSEEIDEWRRRGYAILEALPTLVKSRQVHQFAVVELFLKFHEGRALSKLRDIDYISYKLFKLLKLIKVESEGFGRLDKTLLQPDDDEKQSPEQYCREIQNQFNRISRSDGLKQIEFFVFGCLSAIRNNHFHEAHSFVSQAPALCNFFQRAPTVESLIYIEILKMIEVKLKTKLGQPEKAILALSDDYYQRERPETDRLLLPSPLSHRWQLYKLIKYQLNLQMFKHNHFRYRLIVSKQEKKESRFIDLGGQNSYLQRAINKICNHLTHLSHIIQSQEGSQSTLHSSFKWAFFKTAIDLFNHSDNYPELFKNSNVCQLFSKVDILSQIKAFLDEQGKEAVLASVTKEYSQEIINKFVDNGPFVEQLLRQAQANTCLAGVPRGSPASETVMLNQLCKQLDFYNMLTSLEQMVQYKMEVIHRTYLKAADKWEAQIQAQIREQQEEEEADYNPFKRIQAFFGGPSEKKPKEPSPTLDLSSGCVNYFAQFRSKAQRKKLTSSLETGLKYILSECPSIVFNDLFKTVLPGAPTSIFFVFQNEAWKSQSFVESPDEKPTFSPFSNFSPETFQRQTPKHSPSPLRSQSKRAAAELEEKGTPQVEEYSMRSEYSMEGGSPELFEGGSPEFRSKRSPAGSSDGFESAYEGGSFEEGDSQEECPQSFFQTMKIDYFNQKYPNTLLREESRKNMFTRFNHFMQSQHLAGGAKIVKKAAPSRKESNLRNAIRTRIIQQSRLRNRNRSQVLASPPKFSSHHPATGSDTTSRTFMSQSSWKGSSQLDDDQYSDHDPGSPSFNPPDLRLQISQSQISATREFGWKKVKSSHFQEGADNISMISREGSEQDIQARLEQQMEEINFDLDEEGELLELEDENLSLEHFAESLETKDNLNLFNYSIYDPVKLFMLAIACCLSDSYHSFGLKLCSLLVQIREVKKAARPAPGQKMKKDKRSKYLDGLEILQAFLLLRLAALSENGSKFTTPPRRLNSRNDGAGRDGNAGQGQSEKIKQAFSYFKCFDADKFLTSQSIQVAQMYAYVQSEFATLKVLKPEFVKRVEIKRNPGSKDKAPDRFKLVIQKSKYQRFQLEGPTAQLSDSSLVDHSPRGSAFGAGPMDNRSALNAFADQQTLRTQREVFRNEGASSNIFGMTPRNDESQAGKFKSAVFGADSQRRGPSQVDEAGSYYSDGD